MAPLWFMASGAFAFITVKLIQSVNKLANQTSTNRNIHLSKGKNDLPHHDRDEPETTYPDFLIASSSFVLATIGVWFSPTLLLISLVGVTYNLVSLFPKVYKSLFQARHISGTVINVAAVSGFLFTRHYFIAAFLNWIFYSGRWIAVKMRADFQEGILSIFTLIPNSVWLWQNDVEIEIPLEEANVGDVVVMHTGDIIPVECTIIDGTAQIDQYLLTGQSQPLEKRAGDYLVAFTEVISGKILVKLNKPGKDSMTAKINKILSHLADFKTTARRARESTQGAVS